MENYLLFGMAGVGLWLTLMPFFIRAVGLVNIILFKGVPLFSGLFLIFCVLYFSKVITVNF